MIPPANVYRRSFFGIVAFLVLAMALTAGLRAWRVAHVAGAAEARRAETAATALGALAGDFEARQRQALTRAEALAEAPPVVAALREWMLGSPQEGRAALLRYVAGLDLPPRWAVEVYSPDLDVLAWNGFSMPPDRAPEAIDFARAPQSAIAEDADWRQALALWMPVRDGVRTLGHVRVLLLLEARRPVQNQYLEDYSIADRWRRRVGLPVTVHFQPRFTEAAEAPSRLLLGLDGQPLGRVEVEPPTRAGLVAAVSARYADVLVFWATLLLFVLVLGLWRWYRAAPSAGRLLLVVAPAWWAVRYALLWLDVPARWQGGKSLLAPLFDPTHLASAFGGGLLRSTGDLLLSALFLLLFAFAVLERAVPARRPWRGFVASTRGLMDFAVRFAFVVGLNAGLALLLALVARHAILDSTLDFFSREGLFPRPLVLLIFCALVLATLAMLTLGVAAAWAALGRVRTPEEGAPRAPAWAALLAAAAAVVGVYAVLYGGLGAGQALPLSMAAAFLGVALAVAAVGALHRPAALGWLTLRSVLPAIFVACILLYPLVFRGLDVQRRQRMQDAAELFDEGRDPGVLFALEQLVRQAAGEPRLLTALADTSGDERRRDVLDSLAMALLRTGMPATRTPYDVSLLFLDDEGRSAGRFDASEQRLARAALDRLDADLFGIVRQMYAERGGSGPMIEQLTSREADRFQYVGLMPVGVPRFGWILVRAEPRPLWQQGAVPLLRVLLPEGYGNLYASLSLAEFRDGVLIRTLGRDFGRYRLDAAVRGELFVQDALWRVEHVEERQFLTYYRREPYEGEAPLLTLEEQMVDAVRVPAFAPFDHLYYLLRLTVAGMFIGLVFFGFGLVVRRRAGLLPAPRVRFRDKVLNAFLGVGILAILAVGLIGVQVVSEENERAIQSWLRQHLERVEETLVLDAQGEEMPYRVLDRVRLDSLAARVGLDLNLYQDGRLVRSSRPQLRYERLIDERLPVAAYEDLYLDGFRFTYAEERLDNFSYTAGYRALLDELGRPVYVISVPTLPEQERIEEERARTLAYLFGALLLLVVVVMGTAALLANALARPVARLRTGLKDVAQGRFARKLPVESRDEIGELVATFNEMQEQLSESRRKLAQQERQLAWREMARQVAHEIKNPLTPMKLSVQHLRRTYESADGEALDAGRFARLFERVTGTLIEQIDALARIANDFSTFARMPTRVLERLDLNEVIHQAVRLMQAEAEAEIELALGAEPLVVEADLEELRRTYINLLKNALQALPEAGGGGVRVETRAEAGTAFSAVIDSGTGIPEGLRERIFEPNFSTKTSGTGLGLAIARKTIEEHGGEIGFETEEGVGTTFWIRLPLVQE